MLVVRASHMLDARLLRITGSGQYPGKMFKFFVGLPRWLTVVLALTAAAVLWVVPYLAASSHGWKLFLSIATGAVFTMLAVGLPQIQQWRSNQESRLRVELATEPSELVIPSYTDAEGVIDALLKAEEAKCLSSLNPSRSASRPRGFSSEAFDLDKVSSESGGEGPAAGITIRDLTQMAEKKKSGEALTAEEEHALTDFKEKTAPIMKGFARTFGAQMMSDPDQRSAEEYRSEVEQHLIRYREFLDERLLWEYVNSGIGNLKLTLVNPTSKVFEDVQVEIYLPGNVEASDPEDVDESYDFPPRRPRAFGERTPKPLITLPSYSGISTGLRYSKQRPGPRIDNSGSARIVYRPMTLRPHARMTLDDISLSIQEPPGTVVEGIWEATATNAEGRVHGRLSIKVDVTSVPVRRLLIDSL